MDSPFRRFISVFLVNNSVFFRPLIWSIYTKKYGTAYITVTEKYKGKTTFIGKVKVNVVKAEQMF